MRETDRHRDEEREGERREHPAEACAGVLEKRRVGEAALERGDKTVGDCHRRRQEERRHDLEGSHQPPGREPEGKRAGNDQRDRRHAPFDRAPLRPETDTATPRLANSASIMIAASSRVAGRLPRGNASGRAAPP